MATWHITIDPDVGCNSTFQTTIHALVIKPYQTLFERAGFSVQPLSEQHTTAITVSHANESAMTLFILKNSANDLVIERIS